MPKMTDDQRKAMKAQGATILSSPAFPGHEFAFRRCGVAEFDALMATIASREAGAKVQAHRQLARDLLAFPTEAEWDTFAEQYPGAAHTFGNKVAQLAGLDIDIVVGKG